MESAGMKVELDKALGQTLMPSFPNTHEERESVWMKVKVGAGDEANAKLLLQEEER